MESYLLRYYNYYIFVTIQRNVKSEQNHRTVTVQQWSRFVQVSADSEQTNKL